MVPGVQKTKSECDRSRISGFSFNRLGSCYNSYLTGIYYIVLVSQPCVCFGHIGDKLALVLENLDLNSL